MKEIMRNGLVNGEMQAPHIFHTYRKGILTQDGIKDLHKQVLKLAQTKHEATMKDIDDEDNGEIAALAQEVKKMDPSKKA